MKKAYFIRFSFLLSFALATFILQAQVYVKHDAAGNSDGTSWANAYESVDKALANVTSGEIWVAAGTYYPGGASPSTSSVFTISNNIALYGGFGGTESSLSERDPMANETTLSGDLNNDDTQGQYSSNKSDNTIHVIYVEGALTNVIIDGFSIKGGHTSDDGNADLYERAGGGIYALSPVNINQCQFFNNFGRSGACVYLPTSAGGSTITNSTFSWNSTSTNSPGVMANEVDGLSISDCTFNNNSVVRGAFYALRSNNVMMEKCTFDINVNTEGPGAAMWVYNTENMTILNSTFTNNRANYGGAIYYRGDELLNMEGAENFTLTGCTFTDNAATTGNTGGGAIRNFRGSYTLDDCTFKGNTSTGSGGHIRNSTDGDEVVYKNCLFEDGNTSRYGGAHTCYGEGNYTITNCEYIKNSCVNFGGAVNSGQGAYSVTFDNCTFAENKSTTSSGGALFVQNDSTNLFVLNSYFENNSCDNNGGAIRVFGTQATIVENCEFLLNGANIGGAINVVENDSIDGGTLDVLNCGFYFNNTRRQGGAVNIGNVDASIVSSYFTRNTADGLGTGGALSFNASDSSTVNIGILNCTLDNNEGDIAGGIAQWTGDTAAILSTTIQNTILNQNGGINYAVEGGTPTLVSNGGNMSDDATTELVFTDPTDLNMTSPTFVDPSNLDFTLTTDSPGIDAGVAAGAPEFDILGNPRVNQPDMGAFENQEVTRTHETLVENNGMLTVSPNPARDVSTTAVLKNDWSGELQVRITNLSGQVVGELDIEKTNEELRFELPLREIKRGIYQVTVSDGERMVVDRLVRL